MKICNKCHYRFNNDNSDNCEKCGASLDDADRIPDSNANIQKRKLVGKNPPPNGSSYSNTGSYSSPANSSSISNTGSYSSSANNSSTSNTGSYSSSANSSSTSNTGSYSSSANSSHISNTGRYSSSANKSYSSNTAGQKNTPSVPSAKKTTKTSFYTSQIKNGTNNVDKIFKYTAPASSNSPVQQNRPVNTSGTTNIGCTHVIAVFVAILLLIAAIHATGFTPTTFLRSVIEPNSRRIENKTDIDFSKLEKIYLKQDVFLRSSASLASDSNIIMKLDKGSTIYDLGENTTTEVDDDGRTRNWIHVVTSDGVEGYVSDRAINLTDIKN